MATGIIGQAQIDDALRTMVAEAVTYGEHKGIYRGTVDERRLPRKMGRDWREPALPPLTAFGANPDEEYDSPQQIQDSKIVITPAESLVQFMASRRADVTSTLSLMSMLGELAADGLEQKRDADGIVQYDTAGGVLGTNATVTVDVIAKGATYVRSGRAAPGGSMRTGARPTGDPPQGPIYSVFHEFNRFDIQSQLSGLGGAPTQITGSTAAVMNWSGNELTDYMKRWIEDGTFEARIAATNFLIDNNFSIVGNVIKGGIYAKQAFVHVTFIDYDPFEMPTVDGRFRRVTVIADYGNGKRADNYVIEVGADATAPTVP
jgi:hypothetical protein